MPHCVNSNCKAKYTPKKGTNFCKRCGAKLPDENTISSKTIIVLGAREVGKTCLINRYRLGTFSEKYEPTAEEKIMKLIELEDKATILNVMDTGPISPAALDGYANIGDGFMLVYDVTDYESWRYVQKLGLDLLSKKMTFAVPIVFVGTKADLGNKRVDVEEATMMTSVYKFAALIETSAKNSNVTAAFDTLLEKMLQVEELKPGANSQAAHKKKECKVS